MTTPNPNTATAPRYTEADIAAAVARALRKADDRPRPGPDAGRFPRKYAVMAQDFRTSAWQHLDAGDLPQASNKAWGLVAETIKAISAQHGGIIHKHHSIAEVLTQLRQLVADDGDAQTALLIGGSFMIAERLHINFYEGELSENYVLDGLIRCEELSTRLYALFWPDAGPGHGVTNRPNRPANGIATPHQYGKITHHCAGRLTCHPPAPGFCDDYP